MSINAVFVRLSVKLISFEPVMEMMMNMQLRDALFVFVEYTVGPLVGDLVGCIVGSVVGFMVGSVVGMDVGPKDGFVVGSFVGG